MQITEPRWSPDGRSIAFIGGLMSDEAIVGGDIYSVPAGGGSMTNLTPDMKMSASWLAWSGGSSNNSFAGIPGGGNVIARRHSGTKKNNEHWRGRKTVVD